MERIFIQTDLPGAASIPFSLHSSFFDISKAFKSRPTTVSRIELISKSKSKQSYHISPFKYNSIRIFQKLSNKFHRLFEMVVKYFDAFLNLVPLSFVLGFYVSYVAGRWWQQFLAIPWPDK